MICELHGSVYTVLVTNAEVCEFARSWPANRLDTDGEYIFQFDARNGDLVDVSAMTDEGIARDILEDEDGDWLAALSNDATLVGAEALGLIDVVAIRYPTLAASGF
jgi:hypothetical protein